MIDTCAVDGMCQTACPVSINTGDLVRRLRRESAGTFEQKVWAGAARHWGSATAGASAGLSLAAALPSPLPTAATRLGRKVAGEDTVPLWTSDLPRGGHRRRGGPSGGEQFGARAVLFGACVGTMFGPAAGGRGASGAFRALCARVGLELVIPPELPELCCGTPWKSKGMTQGYAVMRGQVLPALREASRGGELPVVCDASSCTEGLHELLRSADDHDQGHQLRVLDAVEFVNEHVLAHLHISRRLRSVAVHPTCSSTRQGTTAGITAIAASFADEVVIPPGWG